MIRTRLLAALAALACAPAGVRAEPAREALTRADFAYAIELDPTPEGGVQTLLVPVDVYRRALRADLSDVRVFNARGQEVPHAIRTLDAPKRVSPPARAVPIFPIFEPERSNASSHALQLHAERSASGAILEIRTEPRTKPAGSRRIVAYVLDTSGIQEDVVALRLEFEQSNVSFAAPLAIEASEDLSHWRGVSAQAVVARLDHAGHSILRDRIEIPATHAAFLRLSWHFPEPGVRVTAVHAELGESVEITASYEATMMRSIRENESRHRGVSAIEVPAERQRLSVKGRPRSGEPGVYEFDLGGPLPVERVNVSLPDDVLVHAELSSSNGRTAPFDSAFEGQLYRVRSTGRLLTNPPIELGRRRHRYWKLQVDGKGGGLGGGRPRLEVEYIPDQLLFIARGAGPFELAYGSHAAQASAFDPDQVLNVLSSGGRKQLPHQSVEPSKPKTLTGPAALLPPPTPLPIRTYALWAVLVAGAFVLAALALRLLRKLD